MKIYMPSSQKKLLILDDDPEILELLKHILGKQYTILTRSNTETLENDLKEFVPDAILIDHFIGDKTSNEVLNKSLRGNSDIPVILHSAHEEIEKISLDAKVRSFIRKPSSINEIREEIAMVMTDPE